MSHVYVNKCILTLNLHNSINLHNPLVFSCLQMFACDQYEESQFAQSPDLCPAVDKEDNEIAWRTGMRRRDTRWKSASGCHYSCVSPGTGVRLVVGKEKQERSSIQLCQPDQYVSQDGSKCEMCVKKANCVRFQGCGRIKSPFQHATAVCSKYRERVRRLSGLGMQISPVLGK